MNKKQRDKHEALHIELENNVTEVLNSVDNILSIISKLSGDIIKETANISYRTKRMQELWKQN